MPKLALNLPTDNLSDYLNKIKEQPNLTSIDLRLNWLGNLGADNLVDVMGALKGTNVNSINLSRNRFNQLSTDGLVRVISALKDTNVTSINLGLNSLYEFGVEGLIAVMGAFKDTKVTSINLSHNIFYELGPDGPARVIKALKDTNVNSIDLRSNSLYMLGAEGLTRVISALEDTKVTSIDLHSNELDKLDAGNFARVMGAFKDTNVTSINLGNNDLYNLGADDLVAVMGAFKDTKVTSIDLSSNGLYEFGTDTLVAVISALKDTKVTSIDLSSNALYMLDADSLAEVIGILKDTNVTSINLNSNALNKLGSDGLAQVMSAFKGTRVSSIELSNWSEITFNNETNETLAEIFQFMPLHIEKVLIQNSTYSFPQFYLENSGYSQCQAQLARYLATAVEMYCQSERPDCIYFEVMELPFEIDKNLFAILVRQLEKQETAIANFTCGLLLTHQIVIVTEEQPLLKDLEKIMLRGIDFLQTQEVEKNHFLKDRVDFILWHIRTINQKVAICGQPPEFYMPLIEERLKSVPLKPKLANYKFFNHRSQQARTELLNKLQSNSQNQNHFDGQHTVALVSSAKHFG